MNQFRVIEEGSYGIYNLDELRDAVIRRVVGNARVFTISIPL